MVTGIGAVFGYAAITALANSRVAIELRALGAPDVLAIALTFPLIVWVCVLVHEGGHLIGGKLAGLRPALLLAGPLRLDFKGRLPEFRFNRVATTWGGLAVAVPETDGLGRAQSAILVGGGPLASLAFGVFAVGLSEATKGSSSVLLMVTAVMSATIGLATLLPINAGGYASDGGQLLQLARNDGDVVCRIQLAVVIGQSLGGVRPREWDQAMLLGIAGAARAPTLRTSAKLLRAIALDDSESDAPDTRSTDSPARLAFDALAQDLHEGGLAEYPSAFREGLVLPIGIFLAQRLLAPAAARAWIESAQPGVVDTYQRLHAKAAIAWAERRESDASSLAAQALEALIRTSDRGMAVMARERLEQLAPVAIPYAR